MATGASDRPDGHSVALTSPAFAVSPDLTRCSGDDGTPSVTDPSSNRELPPSEGTQARAAEAAAVRRRWITLAEVLTVIAVSISGLTLWNSWSERRDSEATKQAEEQRTSSRAATLVLTAADAGKDKLLLKPAADEQAVQSQTVTFPKALGVSAAETTGEPRIEAVWFEDALEKARDKAGLPDDSRGDERLPVGITTRFLVDGNAYVDVAIYDVGYTITGRWLSGHTVTLRGLSLVSRAKSDNAQARLDARWARLLPHK